MKESNAVEFSIVVIKHLMTLVYFLKFFIHKLDASLQIVLYMVKITLTMRKKCNKTEACWQRVTHWSLPPSPSNTPPSERMNERTNERMNERREETQLSNQSPFTSHSTHSEPEEL